MKKAYVFATITVFIWSTLATLGKILLGSLSNVQVICASFLCAFVFLLIYNIVTGNITKLKKYRAKDYLLVISIGVFGTLFYNMFYYAGAERLLASQAFIINYLWPILSVVFACVLLKEKLSLRKCTAIVLSFIGVLIVTGDIFATMNLQGLIGVLFCILGAVSYGLFTALNKKYYPNQWILQMLGYFVAFVITFIINVFNDSLFMPTALEGVGFVWNGIVIMVIANITWAVALHNGNTAKISNLAYITPFLSLLWSAIILKEEIRLSAIVGLVVIVLGILIQVKDKSDI